MNIKQAIAEAFGMSKDHVDYRVGYQVLSGQVSANGDGAVSTVYCGFIPLKHWRVVGVGFLSVIGGLSTTAEIVEWGIAECDAQGVDPNYFGQLAMDVNANKEFDAGDMYIKTSGGLNLSVDAMGAAGVHTWGAGGSGLAVWQKKAGVLTAGKQNVANSDTTIVPFFLVEV